MIETEKTNYGNWIPRTFMTLCYSAVALLLAIELGLFFASVGTVVLWLVGVVLLLALLFTLYMQVCRWLFSFTGRGLMGKFHEYLLAHLDWDGHGQMLDIGCGAAALTVRCAHTYRMSTLLASRVRMSLLVTMDRSLGRWRGGNSLLWCR